MNAIAAVLLLAFGQDPGASVRELVERLGDDSIEARERAVADLVRLGEPARAAIEKELARASDPEVRARLHEAIRGITRETLRRTFKGGAVVNGLCAAIRVEKEKKEGGAWVVTVEIANVEADPRPFVPIETWSRRWTGGGLSLQNAHAILVAEQISGQRPKLLNFAAG
jgi:hypothetical protein